MGNYKFRLADMMPNAWFYKLRDMSKKPRNQISSQTLNQKITKKKKKSNTLHNSSSSYSSASPSTTTTTTVSSKPNQPHQHSPRKSYYFTRDLNPRDYPNSPINPPKSHNFPDDLPRKSSSKQRPRRRRSAAKHSPNQLSARGAGLDSVWTKSDSSSEFTPESSPEKEFSGEREFRCDGILSTKKVCSCRDDHRGNNCNKEATDIVIDVDKASLAKPPESPPGQFESFAKLELPPIITKQSAKPKKKDKNNNHHNSNSNNNNTSSSPGIRLRMNHSPRIVNKRVSGLKKSAAAANTRRSRSLSDSFAVVKCSSDPQRDFKDSMMEMIVENNIRASKDLEDLLACYLSLNSDEYHGMIIKVFKQIWFDLSDVS